MFQAIRGWTKQRILDTITQGVTAKSMKVCSGYATPTCAYRGENGAKCVIGAFIPDELYRDEMDQPGHSSYLDLNLNGTDVASLLTAFPDLILNMPLELQALQKLQYIHDNADDNDPNIAQQLEKWVHLNVED